MIVSPAFAKPAPSQSSNPFGAPSKTPFNPFSQQTPNGTSGNNSPFGATKVKQQENSNHFASPKRRRSKSPFNQESAEKSKSSANPFSNHQTNAIATKQGLAQPLGINKPNGKRKIEPKEQGTTKFARIPPTQSPAQSKGTPGHGSQKQNGKNGHADSNGLQSSNVAPRDEFAMRIKRQLARDGISPPTWPPNPGSLEQRNAMESLRQQHKDYREKARISLIKAGLIDDPDKRRRLDEALVFKGICQEMCPEWEKITRIHELRVFSAEKDERNGEMVAIPKKMVKMMARSAAGQDAPLPMDILSAEALRKALDYLINELIPSDDLLPSRHGFLWDRTRALRRDFTFQVPALGPEETQDYLYCLETIARFHVVSLHLLSQLGLPSEEFSEQQELEQLGKTLLSLKQAYDDASTSGLVCVNEAEFRAYYIIFNAYDPSMKERVQEWDPRFWNLDSIRTAMSLLESIQNTSRSHGPLTPFAPTEIALDAATTFFSIVASPDVSYTMACFAEIHFNIVRRQILENIKKSYSRPRDGPKDLTPEFLKRRLRFDKEEEAVDFVKQHGLEFEEHNGTRYLKVSARTQLKQVIVPHSFSRELVERKRGQRSLPTVIHETVYDEATSQESAPDSPDEDNLFVQDTKDVPPEPERIASPPSDDTDLEDSEPTPPIPTETPSNPFNAQSTHVQPTLGVTSGTSAFSQANTTIVPSTMSNNLQTMPQTPSLFSGLSGATAFTPQKLDGGQLDRPSQSSSPKNEKKVSFGENTYIEAPDKEKRVTFGGNMYIEPPSTTSSTISTPSSGLFSFPTTDSTQTTAPTQAPTVDGDTSSWFPSTLTKPKPSLDFGNKNGSPASVLPGLSTTNSSGFSFPGFGTSSNGPTQASISIASPPPSLSLPPFGNVPPRQPSSSEATTEKPPEKPPTKPTPTSPFLGVSQPSLSSPFASPQPPQPSTASQVSPGSLFTAAPTPPAAAPQGSAGPLFTASPQAVPKKDPMELFTRWFVCGDNGLMKEHIEEWLVGNLVGEVWNKFHEDEKERKRKEEDEKSWAEARKFREYSLKVTFFYRWLHMFRKRRVVKRILIEKEKARVWYLPENVAKREAEAKAAKEKENKEVLELLRRSAKEKAQEVNRMRESVRTRETSVEKALLASGVFHGLRDERGAARKAARVDDVVFTEDVTPTPSEQMLLRSENVRRRKHGMPPLNRLPEPKVYKKGTKTAKLLALCSGRNSFSTPTVDFRQSNSSFRNSTFSSSYRSSLGFNSSRIAKAKSRVIDPYWKMKANGLVLMPNGDYLHESLALPMLREGKRFPGLGDFGLPPVALTTPEQSPPSDGALPDDSPPFSPATSKRSRISSSPSVVSNLSYKRKRESLHYERKDGQDAAAYNTEDVASKAKRVRSESSVSNEDDSMVRMRCLLQELDNGAEIIG